MKNDSGPEELGASKEQFLRYLRTSGEFFAAFSNLRDELESYMSGWEGIDERVSGPLVCGFAEKFERLADSLDNVTCGLIEINGRIEELRRPAN